MRGFILLLFAMVAIPVTANADIVTYKGSNRKSEVIITKETEEAVWVRGGTEGRSSAQIPKDQLESIEHSTPEENKALQRRWEEEKKAKEKEKEEEEKYEKKMRKEGKVKLGDEWVDPDVALKAKKLQIREKEIDAANDSAPDAEPKRANVEEESFWKRWWRKLTGND